jgi:hypothetical protein
MPHGMFGAVHEAADYGRGQTRPSDCAEVAERRRIDCSQLRDGGIDTSVQRFQRHRPAWGVELRALGSKRLELRFGQRVTARVREQAVDDARYVPNVERRRRDSRWSCVPFIEGQVLNQLPDAFPDLKENVCDGLQDRWDGFNRSSLPPFGLGHAGTAPRRTSYWRNGVVDLNGIGSR